MSKKKNQFGQEKHFRGLVTPSKWDSDDQIIECRLETDDDEYVLEESSDYDRISSFVDCYVEATGVVKRDKKQPVLHLSSIREIPRARDFDDDDDYDDDFDSDEANF